MVAKQRGHSVKALLVNVSSPKVRSISAMLNEAAQPGPRRLFPIQPENGTLGELAEVAHATSLPLGGNRPQLTCLLPSETLWAVSSRHQLSDPLSCPSAARQVGSPGWILSAASNSWIARPIIHSARRCAPGSCRESGAAHTAEPSWLSPATQSPRLALPF